jgi:hypothetical protein
MKVSIVTPTYGRPHFHEALYRRFRAQTHADKELLVLDDSPAPSPFFTTLYDAAVRYEHSAERIVLGEKRNRLAACAQGEVIVHFDDDDHYTPGYVAWMLAQLGDADFVKLGGFFAYSTSHDVVCYWDLLRVDSVHYKLESGKPAEVCNMAGASEADRQTWMAKNVYGFGCTYVYRKRVAEAVAFEPIAHGEDSRFMIAADERGFQLRVVSDVEGMALYVRHPTDSSIIFPQYLLPPFLVERLFGPDAVAFVKRAMNPGR